MKIPAFDALLRVLAGDNARQRHIAVAGRLAVRLSSGTRLYDLYAHCANFQSILDGRTNTLIGVQTRLSSDSLVARGKCIETVRLGA